MAKGVIRVVAAVIEREGRYLLTQRKETAVLPLLWEFPGGRVEDGESDEAALYREVEHRLGVSVTVQEKVGENVHNYPAYDVHISLYACQLDASARLEAINVHEYVWAASSEFDKYDFPPADQATMDRLLGITN